MKKQMCILNTVMLGVFVLLAAGVGYGQSSVRVNVPFSFTSGTQTFSAGEYTLRPSAKSPHTLLLEDRAGQILSYIGTNSTESRDVASSTKLVFHRVSGQYFLAQMWMAGSDIGWETMKSPVEIQLAKYSTGEEIASLSVDGR